MAEDSILQQLVEAAVAGIASPDINVRLRGETVLLVGRVGREEERARAGELARQVDGVREVDNQLVVDQSIAVSETEMYPGAEDLEELAIGEGTEIDLNRPAGTTDPLRAEVTDEPYFPPTDPVIEPLGRAEGGYRVLGGYSESSMDRPLEQEPAPRRMEYGDEQVAEIVRAALKEDAATTDLDIHVHVRNGVVYLHGRVGYLQDVEAAEEVAGRVTGVREVHEQLQLE